MASLPVKYRPKKFSDVTEQSTVSKMLSKICSEDTLDCRNFLLIGPAGTGKAQSLDSLVLTTEGYVRMGDIQIGTRVFTHTGSIAPIAGIFPQGIRPIYRITLSDGTHIDVSDEHLNCVYTLDSTNAIKVSQVIDTIDLYKMHLESDVDLYIDCPIVDWEDKALKSVDILGETVAYLLDADVKYPTYLNKSILYSNKLTRLQFISAMLSKLSSLTGNTYSSTTIQLVVYDTELSDSIAFLFRSLGCADKICCDGIEYFHTIVLSTVVCDYLDIPYPLNYAPRRRITSIKYLRDEECQCILVGHQDHTYISNDFIPTHNTTSARIMADMLNKGRGEPIEIDAASHSGVDAMRDIIQQARSYPVGCDWKVFVIDECFHGNTLVNTPKGYRHIRDLKVDDEVYNMVGITSIKQVYRTKVPVSDLMFISDSSGNEIVTTANHLFFTDQGWLPANKLQVHDKLLNFNDLDISTIWDTRTEVDSVELLKVRGVWEDSILDPAIWKYWTTFKSKSNEVSTIISYSETTKAKFLEYFELADLNDEYVYMYDLEVSGHPSYYVHDVLVHNCHALSNAAWQSLLKTLEENPAKSVFVLATTNPEKIPQTILSRVQTFQLSKISLKGIEDRLKFVIECENSEGRNITYTEDAINYIAKLSNGGMRDALTTLEKALVYSENLTSENLAKSLNLPKYDDFFALLTAYVKKDNSEIATIINDVYNSGINFVKWFSEFHSFVINIVKYIYLQDINQTMIPAYYNDKISKYSEKHAITCLKLANKLLKLNYELKSTQYLQEVALTYLCSVPAKKV